MNEIRQKVIDEYINQPQFGEFKAALEAEMAHHVLRWGDEKETLPQHFQMVLLMVLEKLDKAIWSGDITKFEHHLITIAAVAGTAHKYLKQKDSKIQDWFKSD